MSRAGRVLSSVAVVLALGSGVCACSSGSSGSGASASSGATSAGRSDGADAALHAKLPAAIKSAGVINFAVQQHPPYTTVNGTDYSGPNIDLQEALADVLGVKAQSVNVGGGLSPVLAGLLSGKYDAFAGPVEATPDREQQYDEVSWLIAQTAYLVPKSNGSSIDQLCGKTVAYVSGSVLQGYVDKLASYCDQAGKGKTTGLGLADTNATVLAVKSGRAAGAGTTLDAAKPAAKADSTLGVIVQPASAGGDKENNCMIAPKSSQLGPVLQEAMQKLIDNGTYAKILAKWNLSDSAVKSSQLNPPLEAS